MQDLPIERATYTPLEVARLFGTCRTEIYEAVEAGRLPAIRINRRILLPRAEIHRLLGLTEDTAA